MYELFNSRLNYEAVKQPVKLFLPKRLKQLRGFHLLTQNETLGSEYPVSFPSAVTIIKS